MAGISQIKRLRKQNVRKAELIRDPMDRISAYEGRSASEDRLWNSPDSGRREDGRYDAAYWHKKEVIRNRLNDPRELHARTMYTMREFRFKVAAVRRRIKAMGGDAPLFLGDGERASDPGNRCKLRAEEMVLMHLEGIRPNLSQVVRATDHGIDQSTVSDYEGFMRGIESGIFPDPEVLGEMIDTVRTRDELADFVTGWRARMDGTHVETVVPVHSGERKERIGFKEATGNTAFITSGSGRRQATIMSSGSFGGRTHDIAASFHILDRLERAARCAGAVVTVDVDMGFVGIGGWISPEAPRHTRAAQGPPERRDGPVARGTQQARPGEARGRRALFPQAKAVQEGGRAVHRHAGGARGRAPVGGRAPERQGDGARQVGASAGKVRPARAARKGPARVVTSSAPAGA